MYPIIYISFLVSIIQALLGLGLDDVVCVFDVQNIIIINDLVMPTAKLQAEDSIVNMVVEF